jgi:hypothetical protein
MLHSTVPQISAEITALLNNHGNGTENTALLLCNGLTGTAKQLRSANPQMQHLTIKAFADRCAGIKADSSPADDEQRWSLIVVVDQKNEVLTHEGLLAYLRDCAGARVLLHSESAALSALLAMGFRRLDGLPCWYVFDLFDYKKRPDWFNAEHFAHPHRWDQPD